MLNGLDRFFRYISLKQLIIFNVLILVLILTMTVGISKGSFDFSVLKYFTGNLTTLEEEVLVNIRFPRVLLAAVVGAALSMSGACLQGLFRNPLADPGLIGVSAGAALGAAFSIVMSAEFFPDFLFTPYLLPLSAILGSAFVISILFIITRGFGFEGMTYMLLAGIAINALAGVGIGILTYISDDAELRGLTFWTMGSFGGVTWNLIIPAIVIILSTIIWTLRISRKLDLLQLGEPEAYRLGVDIKKLRFDIIMSSAIIVGISVSLTGMIGFVGLVVPHLVRLFGGVNHHYLLACSALTGAILMVNADLLSRILIQLQNYQLG